MLVPVWFAAGLVWWTLLEYLLHRFSFHGGVARLGLRHLAHHENLRDRELSHASPPAVVLGLGLHALALVPTLGPLPGGAALAGLAAGYAAYEWVHLAVHHPRPRSRLLRRLRRHHLLHHGSQPDARFGVTTTIWDRAFGTMPRGTSADRSGTLPGRSTDTRFARAAIWSFGSALGAPRLRSDSRPALGASAIPGLSRRQAGVVRAVAEALLADEAGPPSRTRLEGTVREVGVFARRIGTQTRLAFRAALLVVQFSPLLFFCRLRRFVSSPLALRIACLERLERGRLGILVVVLKLSVCLAYFEQPEAMAEIGYDGPGLPRSPRPPPGAAAMPAPEERA